ncbi:MAG: hypothetical protein CW338_02010 [Clostridiales bacterium]|nr:hypothetical protein [Clostridiales bacterium]
MMKKIMFFVLHAALLLCVLGIAACLVVITITTGEKHMRGISGTDTYTAQSIVFMPPEPVADTGEGTVDINVDGIARLMLLPGIGESRARDIIEYRENVSPFFYPVDLTCVRGIGEATFEKIKDRICLTLPQP